MAVNRRYYWLQLKVVNFVKRFFRKVLFYFFWPFQPTKLI
uniref:Uncharacterized protein n=1 Tax=Siphoviridae sp. ctC4e1 TaxID=2825375 RepID=A0A8S5VHT9_9CAUD|nr:MAG TPA: hypothetical protein [Siphoviridae sp. ctC4e1]